MWGWLAGGGVILAALVLLVWVAVRKGKAEATADILEDRQEKDDAMRKARRRAATDDAERKRLWDKFSR